MGYENWGEHNTKRYRESKTIQRKYGTEYCIVVTAKGITMKDSKTYRTGIIGKRECVISTSKRSHCSRRTNAELCN